PHPERKNSEPTAIRARSMPSHSNECSSFTKLCARDMDEDWNSTHETSTESRDERAIIALLVSAFACAILNAEELPLIHQPTLTPQDSGTTNDLIAVWPVNPRVVWACGRSGTFTVTTDGGQTWNASVVPGAEDLELGDVQGFSASVAYLMSIGANTTDFRIYKTTDSEATWTMQF